MNGPRLLTISEVGARLGVSRRTLLRWRKIPGALRPVELPGGAGRPILRYRLADVERHENRLPLAK